MSRVDQYSVTATLTYGGSSYNLTIWDKLSGGEVDSEETKYRPGAMGDQITLGGSKMVGNVTISRLYEQGRDLPLTPRFLAAAGKGDMVVTKQSLDVDKNPVGKPLVYSGKLKQVTFPDHDSEGSDAALIALEISNATVAMAA